jgi:hypothetical protein
MTPRMPASTFSLAQILFQAGFFSAPFWAASFWAMLDVAAMAKDETSVSVTNL